MSTSTTKASFVCFCLCQIHERKTIAKISKELQNNDRCHEFNRISNLRSIVKIKTRLASRRELKAKKANVKEMDIVEKKESEGKEDMETLNAMIHSSAIPKNDYVIDNNLKYNYYKHSEMLYVAQQPQTIRSGGIGFFQFPT